MSGDSSPDEVVRALFGVINDDAPQVAARELLDPMVRMHVDSAEFCGIENWYKWIYLLRNCGRIADLRVVQCHTRRDAHDPSLVHASARWTGIVRSTRTPCMSPHPVIAQYRVRNGRIAEMWTRKANYEFIFGRWIRYSICFRLFLAGAAVYLTFMPRHEKEILADVG